jgi:hypothetical protein
VLADPSGLASLGIAPTGTALAALYATGTTAATIMAASTLSPGVSVLAAPPVLSTAVTPDAIGQRHLVFHPIAPGSDSNLPEAVYPYAVLAFDATSGLYNWIGDYTANPDGSLHSAITSVTMSGPPIQGGTFGYDYGGSYTTYNDYGPTVEPDNEVYAFARYPGSYAVQTSFADGTKAVEWLDVKVGWGGVGPETHGPTAKVATPATAVVVISNSQIDVGGFLANAAAIIPTAARAATTAEAIAAVQAAYKNHNNQPIDVTLIGHGDKNYFLFSGSDYLQDNNAYVQAFGKALNGEVAHLTIFSCNVGQGLQSNPTHVVNSLAQDLHAAGGTSVTVTAYTLCVRAAAAGGGHAGYFTADVGSTWVSKTVP